MADTLGNVIDKLVTVDMKMWDNQELLYDIRRMSFDEYKEKYFKDERVLKYPLSWAFKPEMEDDLKYMGIDLTSVTFGKSGLYFKNRE